MTGVLIRHSSGQHVHENFHPTYREAFLCDVFSKGREDGRENPRSVTRSMGYVLLPRSIRTPYSQHSYPSIHCRHGSVRGPSPMEYPRLVWQYPAGVPPIVACTCVHRTTPAYSQSDSSCHLPPVLRPVQHRPSVWIVRRGCSPRQRSRDLLALNGHDPIRVGRNHDWRKLLSSSHPMKENLENQSDSERNQRKSNPWYRLFEPVTSVTQRTISTTTRTHD